MSKYRYLCTQNDDPDYTTVIIECGRQKPCALEDFKDGQEGFDIASIVLRSEILKRGWIDKEGQPINCYIDLRTNLGLDGQGMWFFALSAVKLSSRPEEEECEPWQQPQQTPEPQEKNLSDREGKYSLEDLLGEM